MKKFSLSALRFGRRKKTEAEALGGAAASTSKRSVVSDARAYEVIRKPVITEKATMISEHNQVTFVVATDASKPEIRAAVEKLFKVKVTAVNTMRREGKLKRVRGVPGRRNETKKAIVTLAEGYSIDVTTGL